MKTPEFRRILLFSVIGGAIIGAILAAVVLP